MVSFPALDTITVAPEASLPVVIVVKYCSAGAHCTARVVGRSLPSILSCAVPGGNVPGSRFADRSPDEQAALPPIASAAAAMKATPFFTAILLFADRA
jgi:hypothetical protein